MSRPADLSEKEFRFVRAMWQMEARRVPFELKTIALKLKYRSLGTCHQFVRQLERKGYIVPGERLALVKTPMLSEKAQRAITKKAA